ncbi:MAG: TRAP transporter small permease subunit [Rhodospirillum sp.]|nr:TRAP transporter small permease subunit [Rhodospirillum sp.]MCF8491055.1 TRAP transporter small permease subunit [Rhodospirillum sp.]
MIDLFLARVVRSIDRTTATIGKGASVLLPVLVGVIVVNVALRYGLNLGLIELEELQWHLNGLLVLCCLAFAYLGDSHVRVDIFHARFRARTKAWVEVLGGLLLLLPFVVAIGVFAWDNFTYSLSLNERSPMPGGLPARYVIKGFLAFGFALLGFQGLSAIGRSLLILRGVTPPPTGAPGEDPA